MWRGAWCVAWFAAYSVVDHILRMRFLCQVIAHSTYKFSFAKAKEFRQIVKSISINSIDSQCKHSVICSHRKFVITFCHNTFEYSWADSGMAHYCTIIVLVVVAFGIFNLNFTHVYAKRARRSQRFEHQTLLAGWLAGWQNVKWTLYFEPFDFVEYQIK